MDPKTQLPTAGMVGGGQLARMTQQAAIALGQSLRVLAAAPGEGAAAVVPEVFVGDEAELETLRAFAESCDVVTFDHEHVPNEHVRELESEGFVLRPGARALAFAQDKLRMRDRLSELGLPVPRWAAIGGVEDLRDFGLPCVLKTATGGYDGKGVFWIDSLEQADSLLRSGVRLLAEEKVSLRRELAAVAARSPSGEIAVYPPVETVQRDGVCVEVLAPAPDLPESLRREAEGLARRIAEDLEVTGVLAVELFETAEGLLVNELAMRPHNSGHWTIEGARTGQFEQHLRAVLDYPLGETAPTAPHVVMANLLGGPDGGERLDQRLQRALAADPGLKVHLYGKQVRPGRKIGHVTVCGDELSDVRRRARAAVAALGEAIEE